MSKPVLIHQDKLLKKRRRKTVKRFFGYLSLIVLLWGALSFLSFAPKLSLNSFVVVGISGIEADLIGASIETRLSNNILGFFSGRNFLLLNRNSLRAFLKESFPEIDDIKFNLRGSSTLESRIIRREPVATWCGSKCFYVDESGFTFTVISRDGANGLTVFSGGENIDSPGFRFIDEDEFRELLFFANSLKRIGVPPSEVQLISPLEIRFVLPLGGALIVDSTQDLGKVISYIEVLMQYDNIRFGSDEFMEKLNYIDMRNGDSNFVYKLKGE